MSMLARSIISLQRRVFPNTGIHKSFGTIGDIIIPETENKNIQNDAAGADDDPNTPPQQKKKQPKFQSKHRKQGGASTYKFVDRARIRASAGNGGKGCISYESQLGSSYKKKPDGGHGGHGGDIIIVADENEQSLNMQTHHHKAEDGKNGSSKQMHGRGGKERIIRVPCGVVVKR